MAEQASGRDRTGDPSLGIDDHERLDQAGVQLLHCVLDRGRRGDRDQVPLHDLAERGVGHARGIVRSS